MNGVIRANGKTIGTKKATIRSKTMGLIVSELFESMHVFNLEFPLVAFIIKDNGCEGSIQSSTQESTETEAV